MSDGGAYRTSEAARRSIFDRVFRLANAYFYYRIAGIVGAAARLAKAGKLDLPAQIEVSQRVVRVVEDCGGRVEINGLDRLSEEPVVVICNHMSALETLALPGILAPKAMAFVIKESLWDYPWFGHIMKAMKCITVTRESAAGDLRKVLKGGTQCLREGRSVVVFPQHTRSREFRPEQFNSLGVKLARAAGVRVQPLALKTDFWGRGRLLSDYGPIHRKLLVHFAIADVLDLTPANEKPVHQQVVGFIQARFDEWTTHDSEIQAPGGVAHSRERGKRTRTGGS